MQIITLQATKNGNSRYAIALGSVTKTDDGKYNAILMLLDKEKPRAKYEASDIHIIGKNKDIVLEQVKQLADMYPPIREDVSFLDLTED